jgi:hypothetical protein
MRSIQLWKHHPEHLKSLARVCGDRVQVATDIQHQMVARFLKIQNGQYASKGRRNEEKEAGGFSG